MALPFALTALAAQHAPTTTDIQKPKQSVLPFGAPNSLAVYLLLRHCVLFGNPSASTLHRLRSLSRWISYCVSLGMHTSSYPSGIQHFRLIRFSGETLYVRDKKFQRITLITDTI